MDIKPKQIAVRDLIAGYTNNPNHGVYGYHGKLNIRPPYQREFRYELKQQQAVIETILKGYPLNIMYWSVVDDGSYEMIDGQQRTLSICEYYDMVSILLIKTVPVLYFDNLTEKRKRIFLTMN